MKPHRFFALSLLLNLLLLGALTFMRLHGTPAEPPPAPAQPQPAPASPQASPTAAVEPAPAFSWSRVESSDYPTYISNLRAIACPEATIRDIITADVGNLYRKQRKEVCALAQDEKISASLLNARLQQLAREEAHVLLNLLGPAGEEESAPSATAPARSVAARDNSASVGVVEEAPKQEAVDVPLILIPPTDQATIAPWQQEQLKSMVAEFTKAIGGINQNPNDPAYLERWQKAREDFDELLRTKLGDELYNEMLSRAASLKNMPENQPPK